MVDKAVLKWGYGQRLGELSLLSAKATTGRSTFKKAQCLNLLRTGDYRVMLRVESRELNSSGRRLGAYHNGAVDRCIYDYFQGALHQLHPTPHTDAGLVVWWETHEREQRDYLFGFDKFSQYKNWFFVEDGLEAEEEISVLGVYIVPVMYSEIGQFQMIGHKRHMQHCMDLPLTYKLDYQLQELYAAQEASCQ
jgi:hypothetical protein